MKENLSDPWFVVTVLMTTEVAVPIQAPNGLAAKEAVMHGGYDPYAAQVVKTRSVKFVKVVNVGSTNPISPTPIPNTSTGED